MTNMSIHHVLVELKLLESKIMFEIEVSKIRKFLLFYGY